MKTEHEYPAMTNQESLNERGRTGRTLPGRTTVPFPAPALHARPTHPAFGRVPGKGRHSNRRRYRRPPGYPQRGSMGRPLRPYREDVFELSMSLSRSRACFPPGHAALPVGARSFHESRLRKPLSGPLLVQRTEATAEPFLSRRIAEVSRLRPVCRRRVPRTIALWPEGTVRDCAWRGLSDASPTTGGRRKFRSQVGGGLRAGEKREHSQAKGKAEPGRPMTWGSTSSVQGRKQV